ncbi:unnamed protein product [Musa textilis]
MAVAVPVTARTDEVLLLVGLDDDVGGGVGDAGEHEAGADLVVVEEAAVGLVHRTLHHLAGAGGAGAGMARVGQIDLRLLRCVQDVHVVGAFDHLLSLRRQQLDLVDGHGGHPAPPGVHPEEGAAQPGQGAQAHAGALPQREGRA